MPDVEHELGLEQLLTHGGDEVGTTRQYPQIAPVPLQKRDGFVERARPK
jgi:hypothetical protein